MQHLDQILTSIATECLEISTLKPRMSDALDFHDVAVWQVRNALKAAFDAGASSAGKNVESPGAGGEHPIPVALATPLLVAKGAPLVPGKLYLRLYHGRTDPSQEMDDWGFDGPIFGPLSCYGHTYCCTFTIYDESGNQEVCLETHDDMIRWDGCYYGIVEAFIA